MVGDSVHAVVWTQIGQCALTPSSVMPAFSNVARISFAD